MFTSFLNFSRFYNSYFSLILLAYTNFGRDKNQFPPTKIQNICHVMSLMTLYVNNFIFLQLLNINYIFSKNMKRYHFID